MGSKLGNRAVPLENLVPGRAYVAYGKNYYFLHTNFFPCYFIFKGHKLCKDCTVSYLVRDKSLCTHQCLMVSRLLSTSEDVPVVSSGDLCCWTDMKIRKATAQQRNKFELLACIKALG